MAAADTINVDDLVDHQRFGGFAVRVVGLALLALVADGYDVQVMAFAAPGIVKAWHVQRGSLAPVFSASLLGILVGASLFGWLGDLIGRKRCIVISSVAYGGFCLLCLLAPNLLVLGLLRFLTGVGLGGVLPNAIATAAELSSRRLRPAMASAIAAGITLGGVAPGLISARVGPANWKALFLVGGIAPFVLAALVAAFLPESVGFLVRRGAARERIARLVRMIDPRAAVSPQTAFTVNAAPLERDAGFATLFAGRYALITPLLWLMFATTLLTIYMLTNWMPLLLESSGFTPAKAATTNSLFQAGGVVGCLVGGALLSRFGARLVAAMSVLTLISVAVVARAPLGPAGLVMAICTCGFCLIGTQAVLNGTTGVMYPTAVRSRGVGMALGVGRFGSVAGPLVAGAMVSSGVASARDLFLLPLLPLAAGTLASLVVAARLNLAADAGGAAQGPLKS